MTNESGFNPENNDEAGKEVDPLTKEIHTGERVLEYVNENLDRRPDHLESTAEVHLKTAEQTRETYERMLKKLIPEEQAAFKCALAQGLEDFYYTHYNALRRRLESEGKFGKD